MIMQLSPTKRHNQHLFTHRNMCTQEVATIPSIAETEETLQAVKMLLTYSDDDIRKMSLKSCAMACDHLAKQSIYATCRNDLEQERDLQKSLARAALRGFLLIGSDKSDGKSNQTPG